MTTDGFYYYGTTMAHYDKWRLLLWPTTTDGDYWPDTAEETRSGGLRGNTSVRVHSGCA